MCDEITVIAREYELICPGCGTGGIIPWWQPEIYCWNCGALLTLPEPNHALEDE